MSTCQNKLYIENVTKFFNNKCIVQDINLALKENELVSLLGTSGVGKTTIFNIISGLLLPDIGNIVLDGTDITNQSGNISYMQQKDLLLPYKTIIDNVSLPLIIKGMNKQEARKKVLEHFDEFGLSGHESKYPSELSRRTTSKSGSS